MLSFIYRVLSVVKSSSLYLKVDSFSMIEGTVNAWSGSNS